MNTNTKISQSEINRIVREVRAVPQSEINRYIEQTDAASPKAQETGALKFQFSGGELLEFNFRNVECQNIVTSINSEIKSRSTTTTRY